MKTVSLASILLLAGATATPPPSVGGITPGMTQTQVVRSLGPPMRTERGTGFVALTLFYPGLRIELDEDRKVAGARSTRRTACLGNGLCPGAKAALAYAKLPELRRGSQAPSTGEGCWAEVSIARGLVTAVALVCQP